MVGAGGADLAGDSGGEETVGGGAVRATAGALEDASGTAAAGFAARESPSVPLRLPNTTVLHAGWLSSPQLIDQGRQQRRPRLWGSAAACQPLRDLQNHLGSAMAGGDFRDHLPVVGCRAEDLRLERN